VNDDGEDDVGYKKPPKNRRWKAGESGNPFGRPKKKHDPIPELLLEALKTPVTIEDERGIRTASAREAIVRQLLHKGTRGDALALKQLVILRRKSEETAGSDYQAKLFRVVLVDPDGRDGLELMYDKKK